MSDPEQRERGSPFARVLSVLGVFLFVMAHGVDLFTQTLIFLLGCLCWGLTFGLPAYLCVRYGKRTGVSVVAALFFLAAALDVWSRLANRSDDPVRVEAPRTQHEKQLTLPNSSRAAWDGNHSTAKEAGAGVGTTEPREGMALPGGIDFFRPPNPKALARVEPSVTTPPKKPEADERQDPPKPRVMVFVNTDEGRFFGEAAFQKVASAADKLLKEKGTDLLVETVMTPGKLAPDKAAALKPDEREKVIRGLAEERGNELSLKGVYILICKNPSCLYVHVTDPSEFPPGYATKVKNAMLDSFRDKKFDEGLEKAVALTLDARGLGESK